MDKYVSGRQRKLQVGLSSYSEGTQVVEVIGRVGIGSTVFGAQYDLDVRGNTNLGSSSSNLINIPGRISSSLHPSSDDVYDIGRQQQGVEVKRWKDAHFSGKGTFNAGVSAHDIEIGVGVGAANLIYSTSGNLKLNSNSGITEIDDNVTISGNTGIGTTNPTSKLWVEGDGYFAGVVTASNFYVGNNVVGSGGSLSTLYVSGISTFANGPLLLGGNLGIGTTNPTSKLWVEGDGYFTGVVTASNFYVNDSLVGVKISLGELYVGGISTFATGPVLIGYGSSGGNLGIGTTNPTSRLWVNGNSYFSGIITAGNIDALDIKVRNIDASGIVTVTNGPVLIGGGTSTGTALQLLQVSGGSYVSGNLGIGTTNPVSNLQVEGNVSINGNLNVSIGTTNPIISALVGQASGYNVLGIAVTQTRNGIGIGTTNPFIPFYSDSDSIISNTVTLYNTEWIVANSYNNSVTRLGADSGRSLEIGMGNTDFPKYIDFGGGNFPQFVYPDYQARIIRNSNDDGSFEIVNRGTGGIKISSGQTSGEASHFEVFSGNQRSFRVSSNAEFLINTTASTGTASQRLQVNSGAYVSGNLGIGTTNPTSRLWVNGNSYISGILTATDINSASDIRLKTNIKPFKNTLEKIVQINGVSFNWIENNAKSGGIIAQDVEKVFPELVNDGDHKTVNYNGLIGVLVESIKELKQEIEDLKSRLNCT
jgi:hypothetical protein